MNSQGVKVSYSATKTGSYTQVKGLKSCPDFGDKPEMLDNTTFDNVGYKSSEMGLKPAPELEFVFNIEDPSASSNMKLMADIEDSGAAKWWKVEKPEATYLYESKVVLKDDGGDPNTISSVTMYHAPILQNDGTVIERTVKTSSSV